MSKKLRKDIENVKGEALKHISLLSSLITKYATEKGLTLEEFEFCMNVSKESYILMNNAKK